MPKFYRLLLLLATLSPMGKSLQSQPRPQPDRASHLEVSLVTAGPGRGWMEWVGHSGILVADFSTGEQRFYDYGVFTTSRQTLWGVLTGDLFAGVREEPASAATSAFTTHNRRVTIQKLDLSASQQAEIVRRLELVVQPAHNLLKYRVLSANCATGPRELIDAVTGGALSASGRRPGAVTVRQSVASLSMPAVAKLMMDFTFNKEVDRPATMWELATLPSELEALASSTKLGRGDNSKQPLVSEEWSFGPPTENSPEPGELSFLLAGVAAAAVIASGLMWREGRVVSRVDVATNATLGLLIGVPGAVLLLGWIFTQHDFLWANANLFVANPLLIAAIPLGTAARENDRAALWKMRLWLLAALIGAFGLLLNLAHVTRQDNLRFFCLLLPLIAAQALVEWRRLSSRVERVQEQNATTPLGTQTGVTNGATEGGSRAIA